MVRNLETNIDTPLAEFNIKDYILEQYVPAKVSPPMYQVVYVDTEQRDDSPPPVHAQLSCQQLTYPFARAGTGPLEATVTAAQILVEANAETRVKRVLELIIDASPAAALDYQPGDTIGILPSNTPKEVQQLLNSLQLTQQANSVFQLQLSANCTKKTAKLPPHVPAQTTPLELLRDCLNLRAVLKKQFLSALATCCTAADERAFLSCLSAKEASSYYNTLILERGFTLADILQLCTSCVPTLALLIEHLPRLLPRPYSIANSPVRETPNQIKIIFSIRAEQPGVTTKMLNDLSAPLLNATAPAATKPKIVMYLRTTNTFRYTAQEASDSSQILIGIGTALAPYFGFLEHKQALLSDVGAHKSALGETWLFAGAATEASLLHRERLLKLRDAAVLQRYFECFSRVSNGNQPHYVQELLDQHAEQFVTFLLQAQTVLYVCADGGEISKSIESCVAGCLSKVLHIATEEAESLLKEFRASGKYREDLWI